MTSLIGYWRSTIASSGGCNQRQHHKIVNCDIPKLWAQSEVDKWQEVGRVDMCALYIVTNGGVKK